MIKILIAFVIAFTALFALSATRASAVKASKEIMAYAPASDSLVVVELFTSQGCSSCPPADRVIAELATKYGDKVLPLSFHVDYWNYIGWKDPFSSKENTLRQHNYIRTFNRSNAYTPQAVIGGAAEMNGSSRSKVLREIAQQVEAQVDAPAIDITRNSGDLTVNIAAGKGAGKILAIEYQPEHTTKVLRGENRGRTLKNYNIVTSYRTIGTWNGSAKTISIDAPTSDGLAIVLQAQGQSKILSAARLR